MDEELRRGGRTARPEISGFLLWNIAFLIGKLFAFPIAFALRRYSLLP
jgi:hypothetical protein